MSTVVIFLLKSKLYVSFSHLDLPWFLHQERRNWKCIIKNFCQSLKFLREEAIEQIFISLSVFICIFIKIFYACKEIMFSKVLGQYLINILPSAAMANYVITSEKILPTSKISCQVYVTFYFLHIRLFLWRLSK